MGHHRLPPNLWHCLALCLGVLSGLTGVLAQGTAFSYQGQLADGSSVANGTYDFRFTLWDAATAGDPQGTALVRSGLEVTNGLFNTTLDFGGGFSGASRWLEIAVRTNGAADFTTLTGRQPVLPAPYAMHAATAATAASISGSVAAGQVTGRFVASQIPDLDASKITSGVFSSNRIPLLDAGKISGGVFSGDGGGLTNLPLRGLVTADNSLVAWGSDDWGQISAPAELSDITAVSAGFYHSVALKADGTVVAWGAGYHGQTRVPAGLTNVVAVEAGVDHTLALKADGTIVAWGLNTSGQTNVPAGLGGVVAVSAGEGHNLVLKADGTVVAWGLNTSGQANVPAGLNGVIAVCAGYNHSLALKSNGTVVAWGANDASQTRLPFGLADVVALAAGASHSVALKRNGTVVEWGDGAGWLPSGLGDVVAVAVGRLHSLALKTDGTVSAWGWNPSGQAVVPPGITGIVALAAGAHHNLLIKVTRASAGLARLDRANAFRSAITAPSFAGDGSALTRLNASALSSGTLADARLSGNVALLDGSPVFAPARETLAAGFTGSRTGSGDQAVVHAENTSTSEAASPALRVLGRGTAAEGALSVSANAGPIARFGNASAWVAQIDNAGGFSAASFSGNGSGLTSLNASALATGTVPAALIPNLDAGKVTTGTFAAARIPTLTAGQIPNLDAGKIVSGAFSADQIPNLDAGKITTGTLPASRIPGLHTSWISTGTFSDDRLSANVALRNGSPAFVAPAGARVASFTGSRTGGHSSAAVHVENAETGTSASPALRVLGRGTAGDGALSVSADVGRIARFGNVNDWVAVLDNNGTFSATSFVALSDRNKKAGFAPVDVDAALAKVAALPLTTWHYTNDPAATPHMGPMAQDFHAAFGLGGEDTSIATVDADGVALAAIQALNLKTEAVAAELAAQRAENSALREQIGELRDIVLQLQRQIAGGRR
jgi:hypothetical protein